MPRFVILIILIAVSGVGGFALGEISQMTNPLKGAGAEQDRSVVFTAGQFTVPLFEGENVPFFLLSEINVAVETYDEVSFLSNNRPYVRATILETLFELERRGEIKPGEIDPEALSESIRTDLDSTFESVVIAKVLIDRLLIQETGSARKIR